MKNEKLYRLERVLLLLSLGLCNGIKAGAIDIEEACAYLYSPLMLRNLKEAGASEELYRLIEMGLELEDTETLIPQNIGRDLEEMIAMAIKILTESSDSAPIRDKWFNPIFDNLLSN
ncbi:DUF3969 family protein [Chitinivorax sp. B]|uniref:DUF3969 family protein n=1 Tax=Chitinivorax sp. B TaxID=2502235 RepID=UPI0010F75A40|nr:DUF3969 family protein [Chitinivorax sp. B]